MVPAKRISSRLERTERSDPTGKQGVRREEHMKSGMANRPRAAEVKPAQRGTSQPGERSNPGDPVTQRLPTVGIAQRGLQRHGRQVVGVAGKGRQRHFPIDRTSLDTREKCPSCAIRKEHHAPRLPGHFTQFTERDLG